MSKMEPTFRRPDTEMHPYFKGLVRALKKHGFCIVDFECLFDETLRTDKQLEAFRTACRMVSSEKNRELIIDDTTASPNIIVEIAPHGHPGTVPEAWRD